ncbi:TrkH family potassium uptake protein [Desulfohalovibrio reitneri]|uniref:TrkH family potassium uptake protein n=1 Tax=Desulfohalovibrio reitneri TaxID=1307759 RepID=UPI000689DB8C|nr:potassium transporter TrkG [Desulfohalovibrio reitneri]
MFSLILAGLTAVPLVVSLLFGEWNLSLRYLAVIAFFLAAYGGARRLRVSLRGIQVNEVFVVVALLFALVPLVMTYPMSSAGMGFMDAYFEALSGATTTGLSTLSTVEGLPETFLFARAWMQWYGGLGIVILSLALLVGSGGAAKRLAAAENVEDDLFGGTKTYARRVLSIYLAITLAGLVLVVACGARPFQGLLLVLAGVSTGGFAPLDASLGGYSFLVRLAVVFVCLAGSMDLIMYAPPYRRTKARRFAYMEAFALLLLILLAVLAMTACLRFAEGWGWSQSLGNGLIMGLSAQSTAGFASVDLSTVSPVTKAVLLPAMFVGGGSGSTAGGVKILRILLFMGLLQTFFARLNMPSRAVRPPRIRDLRLRPESIQNALLLILLYSSLLFLSWAAFLAYGLPPLDSLFDVVSALGTVGLSAGVVKPGLPDPLKLILCLDMLMGRVEIIPVLLLFHPATWFARRART